VRSRYGVLLVLAFLLAVSAPAGVAAQTTTRVTIGSNALLVGQSVFGNSQVNVPLRVQCDGLSGFVNVQVSQQRPPFGTQIGFGSRNVTCDGSTNDVVVTVFGPAFPGFEVGQAEASATLSAPSGSDIDTATIHIVAR
jgi:hypothetical protein